MDLGTESTYDDSVFEHDTVSPATTKQTPRENDAHKTDHAKDKTANSAVTKDIQESKEFYDEDDTTLPVLDTTAETVDQLNKGETKVHYETAGGANGIASNKIANGDSTFESQDGDKEKENNDNSTKLFTKENNAKVEELSKTNDKRINIAETLASFEKPIENTPKSGRKVINIQGQSTIPSSRLGRQESDVTSQKSMKSSEFESRLFVNTDRYYFNSGFPSLISYLGPNATNRTSKAKQKKQASVPKYSEDLKETDETNRLSKTHHKKEYAAFSLAMKRKNESTWTRIEAVAKEKMELYERYAIDMTLKLKRQREQINRRSQELLDSLAKIEEKKKEDKIYDSPHGRMWRHHRSMQRRVFNLEPMSSRDKGYLSMSSGRSGLTEN